MVWYKRRYRERERERGRQWVTDLVKRERGGQQWFFNVYFLFLHRGYRFGGGGGGGFFYLFIFSFSII